MTFVRYVFIQLMAYGIDMGGFILFGSVFFITPIYANIMSKIAAGLFAFLVHRNFTFKLSKDDYDSKQSYKYFFLLGINVPVSSGVLAYLLLSIESSIYAKFLSDIIIVFFSFWISKLWVFSPASKK